jgi:hypothetical protein
MKEQFDFEQSRKTQGGDDIRLTNAKREKGQPSRKGKQEGAEFRGLKERHSFLEGSVAWNSLLWGKQSPIAGAQEQDEGVFFGDGGNLPRKTT